MSRTDIHRPVWVQQLDPFVRHWFTDHHDHEDGICDLGFVLADERNWTRGSCYRLPSAECPCLCGCWMCTGAPWNRARRRGERHEWKRVRTNLLKSQEWDGGWVMKPRSGGW